MARWGELRAIHWGSWWPFLFSFCKDVKVTLWHCQVLATNDRRKSFSSIFEFSDVQALQGSMSALRTVAIMAQSNCDCDGYQLSTDFKTRNWPIMLSCTISCLNTRRYSNNFQLIFEAKQLPVAEQLHVSEQLHVTERLPLAAWKKRENQRRAFEGLEGWGSWMTLLELEDSGAAARSCRVRDRASESPKLRICQGGRNIPHYLVRPMHIDLTLTFWFCFLFGSFWTDIYIFLWFLRTLWRIYIVNSWRACIDGVPGQWIS